MDVIFSDGTEKIVIEYKTNYDKEPRFLVSGNNNTSVGNVMIVTPFVPTTDELYQIKIIRGYIKDDSYIVQSGGHASFEHNSWSGYEINIMEPDGYATLSYHSIDPPIESYVIQKVSNIPIKPPKRLSYVRVPVEDAVELFDPVVKPDSCPIGIKYRTANPLIFEP